MHTIPKSAVFLAAFALVFVTASTASAAPFVMSPAVEVLASPPSEPAVPGPSLQPTPPEELPTAKPPETAPTPAVSPPEAKPQEPVRKGVLPGSIVPRDRLTTWDLNLEGALGWAFPETDDSWRDKRFTGFVRARVGVLHVHDSWYFSAGPTFEMSKLQPVTFGLQGEVMNLEAGMWAQAGALMDGGAHPGAMGAIGWSLFGVEAQYRVYDKYNLGEVPAVYFKIRLPIGVLFSKFAKRDK